MIESGGFDGDQLWVATMIGVFRQKQGSKNSKENRIEKRSESNANHPQMLILSRAIKHLSPYLLVLVFSPFFVVFRAFFLLLVRRRLRNPFLLLLSEGEREIFASLHTPLMLHHLHLHRPISMSMSMSIGKRVR